MDEAVAEADAEAPEASLEAEEEVAGVARPRANR